MDDLNGLGPKFTPTARRPLLGMTILVVEDSRFASEALRLMCLRSGARIRRADCLRSARKHLKVYRPSAVAVDLGLPDGSGLDLIDELSRATPRVGTLLAMSGDDQGGTAALAAGADMFLVKPIETIGIFQNAILSSLPRDQVPSGPISISPDTVEPDQMAYRDDMSHIANLLDDPQSDAVLDYVAQFLSSVAQVAADRVLEEAAQDFADARAANGVDRAKLARLSALVQDRLHNKIAI
ncbi:MAG: response regulator [Roseovarius sp.]